MRVVLSTKVQEQASRWHETMTPEQRYAQPNKYHTVGDAVSRECRCPQHMRAIKPARVRLRTIHICRTQRQGIIVPHTSRIRKDAPQEQGQEPAEERALGLVNEAAD